MAKILTKNSVEYLRTDIENEQLFHSNTGALTIVNPADLLPSNSSLFALKFHTTGNGIIYLSGRAVVQQAITTGTVLFTFPVEIGPLTAKTFRASYFSAPNFSTMSLEVLISAAVGEIIAAEDFGVLNDQIIFEPAFFLQG